MARPTAAATAVLMKFSMSLFRIPGASRVAASALSTAAPAAAPTTTARVARAARSADDDREDRRRADQPERDAHNRERKCRRETGRRSFDRHGARGPRLDTAEGRDEERGAAPCLADLARYRVAGAGGERSHQ